MNPLQFVAKVAQTNGKPIIFLPDRRKAPRLPFGPGTVLVDGNPHETNFAKIAVNAIRKPGDKTNVLPEVLRAWFGVNAGMPGTKNRVTFTESNAGWILAPVKE